MKKILIYISISTLFFAMVGCGKENVEQPDYASVLYINAAPLNINQPLSSLYINDSIFSNGFVGYNTNTGYFGLLPKPSTFKIKLDNGVISNTAPVIGVDGPGNYNINEAYTIVSFDTLNNNSIKILKLRDTLTVPDITSAKVRFLQLALSFPSIATPNVDVTYLRTSVTPNDSVTVLNRNFPTVNASNTNSAFTTIPFGTYSIRIKQVGTQVLAVTPITFTAGRRKIYTHYLTGNAAGRGLAFGQVINF